MPGDPKQWRVLSFCERAVNHWHEAAIASLEALVLGDESDAEREDLILVYSQLTPGVPAVQVVDGRNVLNAGNAQLRADANEAMRDLVRRLMEQQLVHEAREMAEAGIRRFGCPAGAFDDLLK
jgi:hypothetical protein